MTTLEQNLIFIHGLEGSSQGVKATLLRGLFPHIVIPDFPGNLDERMEKLEQTLGGATNWIILGSSFGGLMAALYTSQHPERIQKLILLAPALIWPDFADNLPDPVDVPTLIYHGRGDTLIPLENVRNLAEKVFSNLEFHVVDDDHGLCKTAHALDWLEILEN
jgi:pimeloyl-ACP methyl ester carboxylesterase